MPFQAWWDEVGQERAKVGPLLAAQSAWVRAYADGKRDGQAEMRERAAQAVYLTYSQHEESVPPVEAYVEAIRALEVQDA